MSSPLIRSIAVSSSSKSKIRKFSSIRFGVVDFGKTMSPRCTCQRSTTWAGVRPTCSAMSTIVGSSSTLPWAIGDHASVRMLCALPYARTCSLVRYGCTSIWLTAGTTSASAASRSRCGTWKFDTPIERARPSRWNSSSTFQVETKSPS